jgi:hypothetical protein
VTPERYQQVKLAFRRLLELPPEERLPHLHAHHGADPELLAQVESLLASDSAPTSPIDNPAVSTQFRLRALSLSYTATRH